LHGLGTVLPRYTGSAPVSSALSSESSTADALASCNGGQDLVYASLLAEHATSPVPSGDLGTYQRERFGFPSR